MALQTVETTEKYVKVNKLTELDVEFISLVPKGANRIPFQIVKSEDGTNMAGQVIQSFIMPNTAEFDELKKQPGNEWMAEIELGKCEKSEFQNYRRFTLVNKSEFDEGSLDATPVGDGWVVTGQLKDAKKLEKASIPMITVPASYQTSAGDLIQTQLWHFTDIMWASLYQAAADPKKRKTNIMNALSNFWDFLSAILDEIPASALKGEQPKRVECGAKPITVDNTTDSITDSNTGGLDMTKEDVTAIVNETLEAKKVADEAAVVAAAKDADTPKPETVSALTKAITDISAMLVEVKTEIATLKEAKVDKKDGDSAADATAQAVKSEVVEEIQGEIKKLTEKLDSITHSTTSAAPVNDGEPKVKGDGPKGTFSGAW